MDLSIYTHINGLAQDCGNSIANTLEYPEAYVKPSIDLILEFPIMQLIVQNCYFVILLS